MARLLQQVARIVLGERLALPHHLGHLGLHGLHRRGEVAQTLLLVGSEAPSILGQSEAGFKMLRLRSEVRWSGLSPVRHQAGAWGGVVKQGRGPFNTSPLLGIGAPLLRVFLELLPRDPRLVALVAELLRLWRSESGAPRPRRLWGGRRRAPEPTASFRAAL